MLTEPRPPLTVSYQFNNSLDARICKSLIKIGSFEVVVKETICIEDPGQQLTCCFHYTFTFYMAFNLDLI